MKITAAESAIDKEEIYRFRYDVYVREFGKSFPGIDHSREMITDEADKFGVILGAYKEQEGSSRKLVGTVRVVIGSEAGFGKTALLYSMHTAGNRFPLQCSITSRLVVAPELRSTTLTARLAIAAYHLGATSNVRVDYIHCRNENRAIFEKLGYRSHAPALYEPELGHICPMALILADGGHFQEMASPFRRLWKQYYGSTESLGDYPDLICFAENEICA